MTVSSTYPVPRAVRLFYAALIAAYAWRVLQIAPRWIAGAPPAYPGQYERRLFNAISGVSLLSAVLISRTSFGKTPRGRVAFWGLFSIAVAVLVGQIMMDR